MGIDKSGLAFPKGPTQRKRIHAVRRKRKSVDLSENDKVRERSEGRCELIESHPNPWSVRSFTLKRCTRRAAHVHHLLGGIGVRGRGKSALAENKLHLCGQCHVDVHARVLVYDGGGHAHCYQRIKARRHAHAEAAHG